MNSASSFLFRRMPYYLSPQMDIYQALRNKAEEQSVLEVGFGTGMGVLQYADVATDIDALEPDPAAFAFALQYIPLPNVDWHNESIESFVPAPGFQYTRIFMVEVLEHIKDADAALTNIRKLLYSGGEAIITVPNKLRYRKKNDTLIEHEWDASDFYKLLRSYFEFVNFTDHSLRDLPGIPTTTETPLIALCSSAS